MKKRIVSLILAVLVVAGLATAVFAAGPYASGQYDTVTDAGTCRNGHTIDQYREYVAPTCTRGGNIAYYRCSTCFECYKPLASDPTKADVENGHIERPEDLKLPIDPTAHKVVEYRNLKYRKSAETCKDYAVYFKSCKDCHVQLTDTFVDVAGGYAAHELVKTDAKAATCTEAGNKEYWTCNVCNKVFSDKDGMNLVTDTATLVISAKGHVYDKVRYTWTEDHAKCTASRTCTVCDAVDSEEATATKSVIPATCTTDGKYQYTATFTKNYFTTQTFDGENIPKLGHDWKERTWTWTQKGDSWTVKLVLACNRVGCTETAEPKVTLTSKVTIEPTATKVGERTWTATATQDGQTFTSIKKTEIPKKGSDYYYGATLYFETNGGSKIDAVTVYTDTTIDLTLAKYTPTRRGYTFAGWYSDKNLRYPISEITLKTGWFLNKYNIYTVYAGWYDGDYDYNCSACAFRDVDVNDWFHDYVRYVVDNGILNGISSRWFEPQQAMTREQLVCAMYRIAGSPSVRYNGVFTDVKSTDSFAKAVEWAANYGIVNGIGNKLFDPYSPVTREQMAAIFYRFAKYVEKYGYTPYRTTGFYWNYSSTLTFKDADKISNYAKDPVAWCVKNGIFYGDNSNRFNPTNSTTRAEGAAILTRFCK